MNVSVKKAAQDALKFLESLDHSRYVASQTIVDALFLRELELTSSIRSELNTIEELIHRLETAIEIVAESE